MSDEDDHSTRKDVDEPAPQVPDERTSSYFEKLIKYIPGELIAAYISRSTVSSERSCFQIRLLHGFTGAFLFSCWFSLRSMSNIALQRKPNSNPYVTIAAQRRLLLRCGCSPWADHSQ